MSSTPAEMQEVFDQSHVEPVYQVSKDKSQGIVHFELDIPDLNLESEADTSMFISSPKAGGMVYAGPFKQRFAIEIDERLTRDGPGDSLEFVLFRFKHKHICVQAQQVGEPYWQPGATVKVTFLRERYTDKTTGVPIGFEVEIKKP